MKECDLNAVRERVVARLLGLFRRVNAGHIGSCLSCVELLIHVFRQAMGPHDQFILSKGHAAAALYTVLADLGRISEDLLDTFYQDGTLLAAHPPCQSTVRIPEIPFGTGSLGHGLSLAAGLALGDRFRPTEKRHVFCLVSDGDCNEGSTWEAALFASHQRLNNLTVIVDCNAIQGFGTVPEVLNMGSLAQKWEAFGFHTFEIEDGNDFEQLARVFLLASARDERPTCIVAHTTKGNGVSFMENTVDWHYLPMNQQQFEQALTETAGRNQNKIRSNTGRNDF